MPADDIIPTTSTSSLDADKYCVMIYRIPISEDRIRYIKKHLSIPIEVCKKSSSYRKLLEETDFDRLCNDFYVVPDVSAITAVICATGTEHFIGWYGAEADQFIEYNSAPYTLYSDVLKALQDMMYKASDWTEGPGYTDDDEVIDAHYSLNDLCGKMSDNLLVMIVTANELMKESRSE